MDRLFFMASLLLSLAAQSQAGTNLTFLQGGLVRGDSTRKNVTLIFTADEWAEGLPQIRRTLRKEGVKGAFFFTGRTYRNKIYRKAIQQLVKDGHYFGPHSDRHLLYCDWVRRDSLLVTKDSFAVDIAQNITAMKDLPLPLPQPLLFVPPYEWWNDTIAAWSKERGLQLLSFTPGIRTAADYTFPEMGEAYKSTGWILHWLKETVAATPQKWNGAIILVHAGTDPRRKDKLYTRLSELIQHLKSAGFSFQRTDDLF